MPKTIKIPLLGPQPKGAVIMGGVAAAGVTAYLIIRHMRSSGTPASASGYGYGYAYGAYGYGAYGYGQTDTYGYGTGSVTPYPFASEYGYGAFGYGQYNPYTGQYLGGGGGVTGVGTTPGPTGAAPATNAQWTQNVITQLQGVYPEIEILAATGRYLSGRALGATNQKIIESALAIEGDPPQAGANGYPPKVKIAPQPGQKKPGQPNPGGHNSKPPTHYITANGHQDLYYIARNYNLTESQLLAMNLNLSKYVGSKKPIPKGTRVKV
jgi:hypothetical protein